MANTYKFHIGLLNSDIHNYRMISFNNDVVTEGNMLLSDYKIDMLIVLCINSQSMEFMQSKYGNFSRQIFNVTILRSDGEE